ncbi:MAG: Twin-arginine translocation protein TatA [uncultured Sulfurovum sp.]|uniref:Sec-independent protein translocase protein TatA n=1 Tax=uncultured Sulfurovum sp. TaxID=269237 RepID=A0A6S6S3D8_9BACT|nr:MAG: Twin-arginine translocation protein TatA [uncultured Sulfurovum sp.]
MPGGIELAVIVGVVILLFGGKKIPELAKGIGKGIKDFKSAVKEDDEKVADAKDAVKEIKDDVKETVAEVKDTATTTTKQA